MERGICCPQEVGQFDVQVQTVEGHAEALGDAADLSGERGQVEVVVDVHDVNSVQVDAIEIL